MHAAPGPFVASLTGVCRPEVCHFSKDLFGALQDVVEPLAASPSVSNRSRIWRDADLRDATWHCVGWRVDLLRVSAVHVHAAAPGAAAATATPINSAPESS
jgi:hypothetical protein